MGFSTSKMKRAIETSALGKMEIIGDGQVRKRFCFRPDFIGFEGHFPGYPLLPAFVQIMTGVILLEEQKMVPLELVNVSNAKFLIQVRPDQGLTVECQDFSSGDQSRSNIRISTPQGLAASFRLTYLSKGEDGDE